MDLAAVLAAPGVVGTVTAQDVPGDPLLATFVHDEPIFAGPQLMHVGQVMGLVLGHSHTQARQAARQMRLQTTQAAPLLHAREAQQAGSFVLPQVTLQRGDTRQALAQAPHRLQGSMEIGGQEHFYLESQIAYAIPQDNGHWLIHSGTQHPGEVQHWVAHALHIPLSQVRVCAGAWVAALAAKKRRLGIWPCGRRWPRTSSVGRSRCGWTGATTS